MFAARFDPGALIVEDDSVENAAPVKRTASDADLSEDEESEGENESSEEEAVLSEESIEEEQESASESESEDEGQKEDTEQEDEEEEKKKEEAIEREESDVEMVDNDIPQEHDSKFSSIISRFNKSITKSKNIATDSESEDEEESDTEKHKLIPLPQPELPRDIRLTRQQLNNNLSWLSTPIYISPTDKKPFNEFQLNEQILNNLNNLQFENAFATQIKTLELLLPEINNKLNPNSIKGDLLVNASTGSGKTLAYTIPIIQSLANRIVPRLRCIILVPTKPLIQQVYKTFTQISRGIDLNIVTLGKNDYSLNEEHLKLVKTVPDIIITTPGRLVDHLNLKSFELDNLQWCVIDEADRLLNQSFQDWSNILISRLNKLQQDINITKTFKTKLTKMIFSATLTTDPGKLTNLKFNKPRLIIVNDSDSILTNDQIFTLPPLLKESVLKLSSSKLSIKPLLLIKLLKHLQLPSNVLIFTKSNESTLRLSRLLTILCQKLNIQLNINNINSALSSSIKSKLLTSFSNGDINVLISTDLIARGIDISTIKHVINYDLPNSSREYVHRVGRTARAGTEGDAYSLVLGKGELKFWDRFNLDINRNGSEINSIEIEDKVEDYEQKVYEESLKTLEQEVFGK